MKSDAFLQGGTVVHAVLMKVLQRFLLGYAYTGSKCLPCGNGIARIYVCRPVSVFRVYKNFRISMQRVEMRSLKGITASPSFS